VSLLILIDGVILIAIRSEDFATSDPERRTDAARASAAGSLLSPRLLATAGDFVSLLRLRGRLTGVSLLGNDGIMDRLFILIGDPEYLFT
jgi:hypothetical protein